MECFNQSDDEYFDINVIYSIHDNFVEIFNIYQLLGDIIRFQCAQIGEAYADRIGSFELAVCFSSTYSGRREDLYENVLSLANSVMPAGVR